MLPPSRKILFISPQPFMADRGSPLRVSRTLESLVRLGFDVDLLCYPLGTDIGIPGVKIHRGLGLPGVRKIHIGPSITKIAYDILLFVKAIQLSLRGDYVAIHAVEEAALIAAIIGKVSGKKYIVDMHSSMQDELKKSKLFGSAGIMSVFDALERWWIRGASGVLTVCDRLTNYAKCLSPSMPAFTGHDVPLKGLSAFDPQTVTKLRLERKLDGKRVLLYTGNFQSYQGVELLIRSFAIFCTRQQAPASKSANNVILLLVGGGADNSIERKELELLVQKLGIQPYVVFVEQRPAAEMANFTALGDVLISPRISGCNTPLKVYSYLATDKPVIATGIESHTQVVDENSVYLCDITPASMADSIERAFDNSPLEIECRRRLIAASNQLIQTKYNEEMFFKAIEALYQGIGSALKPAREATATVA